MAALMQVLRLDKFEEFKDFPIEFLNPVRFKKVYDVYEYVGDAILHTIMTDIFINRFGISDPTFTSGKLTKLRGIMESNVTLAYMADKSGLTKAGNLTRSNIKPRADLFEAVIGMLYIYLRSGDKEDIALDTIAIWLDYVFHITNVLDGYDAIQAIDIVYPKYGPWSNWSTCDLETSRTRKCIYGDCNETKETKTCYEWSPCDMGLTRRMNPTTQEVEYQNCTSMTPCLDGKRYIINDLLGTKTEVSCIPIGETYYDATCFDGFMRLYRNTDNGPELLDTIPCEEKIINLEQFTNLTPEQQEKEFQHDLEVLDPEVIDKLTKSNEDLITKHKQVIRILQFV